jgi:flagellar hook-associated protein 1 FlgK
MLNSLHVAQTGLSASKTAVENVSNNIANENTPGYKKRVVQISELDIIDSRFTGRGVTANEAYRVTSQYMYDTLMEETSKFNYYEKVSQMVGNVETMFRETDTAGFSFDLDRYFQAMENLRANPTSEIHKTTLKTQGNIIVDSLQNLYADIEKEETLVREEINESVDKINNILKEIGDINVKIEDFNGATNDLLDKRDQLESELSKYIDVTVDRTDNQYQLSIGGTVAIRFNTNVRQISVVDEPTAQADKFVTTNVNGNTVDGIKYIDATTTRDFNVGDKLTYKLNNEHEVSVTIGETINFDLDGDGTTENVTIDDSNYIRALVHKINSNTETAGIVTAYNGNYTVDEDGNKLTNDYKDKFLVIESDVAGEAGKFEGRISFTEPKVDSGDTFTYEAEGTSVSVSIGDTSIYAADGSVVAAYVIDETNYTTALSGAINNSALSATLTADVDTDGFLQITENVSGTEINGSLTFTSSTTSTDADYTRSNIFKDDFQSQEALDKVYLSVYGSEVSFKSGSLKAQLENLTTDSGYNRFTVFKDKLDAFARALSDVTDKYVKTGSDQYIYGHVATDEYNGIEDIRDLNLFSGGNVKSLKFNEEMVNELDQEDLDYLAQLQWKKDIGFDGLAQDGSNIEASSFSEFYQELKINISTTKENNDFLLETQESVKEALQFDYDQYTKVDGDEEMINLIKFQAAYTANAKIITVVDEMLQTLLGLKK